MRISDWSSDVCSSDLASKTYNDEINSELLATPAGSYFNGSLTRRSDDKRYEIPAGVRNIADRRVVVSGYTHAKAIYSCGFSRPREWKLTLTLIGRSCCRARGCQYV